MDEDELDILRTRLALVIEAVCVKVVQEDRRQNDGKHESC